MKFKEREESWRSAARIPLFRHISISPTHLAERGTAKKVIYSSGRVDFERNGPAAVRHIITVPYLIVTQASPNLLTSSHTHIIIYRPPYSPYIYKVYAHRTHSSFPITVLAPLWSGIISLLQS